MPKQRARCNARTRQNDAALYRAAREGRLTEYLRRSGTRCRNWPERGQKRCRFHGGRSTGPTTPDGKARTVAAMKAGRARWLAELKSEGKPIPCGRKKGGRNLPGGEREQIACEKRRLREGRLMLQKLRAERRAQREETVAKCKIMRGGRLARTPGWAIGLRKNWRNFDRLLSPAAFPCWQSQQLGRHYLQYAGSVSV